MVADGYALDDKVSLSGATMTGNLNLQGSPHPLTIPSGAAAGLAAISDASGNVSWGLPLAPAASSQALSNGSTITPAAATGLYPLTATGAVTGLIIAPPPSGLSQITLVNQSSSSLTFAASGTSNVADGTSDVIAALTCRTFIYDANTSLWYRSA
jgi:hypothetical protein